MGGAQAVAALALGTESVSAGRRHRRPRQPLRPGGQAPAVGPRRDRQLRRAERPAAARRRRRSTPEPLALDLLAQAEHGPGTLVVAASADRSLLDALARELEAAAARPSPDAVVTLVELDGLEQGARAGPGVRARAPPARRPGVRGARAAMHPRRLRVRRRRRRHRVRGLHRRVQPRAADGRSGPLRLRPHARRTSSGRSPRFRLEDPAAARPGGGADRAGRGLRAPRRARWRRASGTMATMTRSAEIDRRTAETQIRVRLALEGSGAGEREHRSRLSRPHARPARPPRRPRPRRARRWRSPDRRPPHRRGRRDLHRPGARPCARRPRRNRALRPRDRADGRSPRRVRDRHLRPRTVGVRGGAARRARSATTTTS